MKDKIARVLDQSYGPFPEGQTEKMSVHIANTISKSQISIGFTPIDVAGEVYQSEVSNAYQHMFGHGAKTRKSVRKVYSTERRAASYSPVGLAKEVFINS